MSFLFRPTPVITLTGKTVGTDHVPMRRLPAGTMHGYARNMESPRLNAIGRRTVSGSPWLISSGTMGSFLDDGLTPPDIFGPIDVPSPDFGGSLVPPPFDYSGAFAGPLLPPVSPLNPAAPIAPDIGTPWFSPAPLLPVAAPPPPVISSAGSAPRQATPSVAPAAVAGGSSILTSIANFFKPTVSPTPMTAAMPGVYKATTVTPSFLQQSSLLPGVANSTALFGGVAVLLLFAMLGGKKK